MAYRVASTGAWKRRPSLRPSRTAATRDRNRTSQECNRVLASWKGTSHAKENLRTLRADSSRLGQCSGMTPEEQDRLSKLRSDCHPAPKPARRFCGSDGTRKTTLDSDPDPEVRLYAVESLVLLGDKQSRDRVPEALEAISWRVRLHPRWKKLRKAVENGEPLTPWIETGSWRPLT
jgi:hypothetical protein